MMHLRVFFAQLKHAQPMLFGEETRRNVMKPSKYTYVYFKTNNMVCMQLACATT